MQQQHLDEHARPLAVAELAAGAPPEAFVRDGAAPRGARLIDAAEVRRTMAEAVRSGYLWRIRCTDWGG